MNDKSVIHVQIQFSDTLLPIVMNDDGHRVVPLKLITDSVGIEWERQRKKVSETYLVKRLGTCTVQVLGADQRREMVCIRLNRVAAFLNTVNPENVRGHGNEDAADFLERKQEEWDDLIDAYERGYGILAKGSKRTARKQASYDDYLKITRAKDKTQSEPEKKVLDFMARQIARDLGVPEGMETAST